MKFSSARQILLILFLCACNIPIAPAVVSDQLKQQSPANTEIFWTILKSNEPFNIFNSTINSKTNYTSNFNQNKSEAETIDASERIVSNVGENDIFINSNNILRQKTSHQVNILKLWDNLRGQAKLPTDQQTRTTPSKYYGYGWTNIVPRSSNNNYTNGEELFTLRILGPNIVPENSTTVYEAEIIFTKNNEDNYTGGDLNVSNVKYFWYLHNSELQTISTLLLLEPLRQIQNGLSSRLQIYFPLVNDNNRHDDFDKNYYCPQKEFIINVDVLVEIGHDHVNDKYDNDNDINKIIVQGQKFINVTCAANDIAFSHGARVKRNAVDNGNNTKSKQLDYASENKSNVITTENYREINVNSAATNSSEYSNVNLGTEIPGSHWTNNDNDMIIQKYNGKSKMLPTTAIPSITTITDSVTSAAYNNANGNSSRQTSYLSTTSTSIIPLESNNYNLTKKNLTKDEISALLLNSENSLIDESRNFTSPLNRTHANAYLLKIHTYAENLCVLLSSDGEDSIQIAGQLAKIQVQYISKRLENNSQTQMINEINNGSITNELMNSTNQLKVEFKSLLRQYCYDVDEGTRHICKRLCLAAINFRHDLLDNRSVVVKNGIWETFLVNYENKTFLSYDNEPEFYQPIVFYMSISNLSENQFAFCSQWNTSTLLWDKTGCQSKLISSILLECQCRRFGYLKVQHISSNTSNFILNDNHGLTSSSVESESVLVYLCFRIYANYTQVVEKKEKEFLTCIKEQLVEQLRLNETDSEADLEAIEAIKHNGSILIRFKLSMQSTNLTESHNYSLNYEEEMKALLAVFQELLQNNSLILSDLQGKRLSVPAQSLEMDEPLVAGQDVQHINLTSGIVIGIIISVVIIFIIIVGVRKYKKERANSVRRVKGGTFEAPMTPFSTFPNSVLTHPLPTTEVKPDSSISNTLRTSRARTEVLSPTNFRSLNLNSNTTGTPDKNQNLQINEHEISMVDVNPNAVPGYTLKSFPNSTIH